ncbi:MAG TPA: DinB family protein [Candidatus Eisenbacteria bacterium]
MTVSTAARPAADEHIPYYGKYIALATESEAVAALEAQLEDMLPFLRGLGEEQGTLRYAPGKWSIKEVIGHLIDSERVFAYRAMRIARADRTPLAGFDENTYVPAARFDRLTLKVLVDELELVRRSNLAMFRGLDEDAWVRRGTANDNEVSVRALAFIIAGHGRHHVEILQERYLRGA